MNGSKTYRRWLRRTLAFAVLAGGAVWSCLALVEERERAFAQEYQESQAVLHPAFHSVSVENLFPGLR